MTLGERMRELREARGLSQEELAEALDVSRQTVSNWENDRATPDAVKFGVFCAKVGASADELLRLSPPIARQQAETAEAQTSDRTSGMETEPLRPKAWHPAAWFFPLTAAVLFLVTAAVGLILCAVGVVPTSDMVSSVFVLTNTTIFYLFLALGAVSLFIAILLLMKHK